MTGIASYDTPGAAGGFHADAPALATLCLRLAAGWGEVPLAAVKAAGRQKGQVARVRHLAAYLAHVGGGLSQRRIARDLCCHVSSVAYALRRIEEERESPHFDREVAHLEGQLQGHFCGLRTPGGVQ